MQRNDQPLCHGFNSLSFCFSSSPNRWLRKLYTLLRRRYVLSSACWRSIHLTHFQLVRDLGITNGNESQVGYYVGLLVREAEQSSTASSLTRSNSRNRYFLWLRHWLYCTGVAYLIVSAENRCFWLVCLVYQYPCIVSDSREPFGVLYWGISWASVFVRKGFHETFYLAGVWTARWVRCFSIRGFCADLHMLDGNSCVMKRYSNET